MKFDEFMEYAMKLALMAIVVPVIILFWSLAAMMVIGCFDMVGVL